MKVTMLLADSAQVAENKLFILGAGWSWTGPGPSTFAIAGLIEIPWDQTNRIHHFLLRLLDDDGQLVLLGGSDGELPLIVEGNIEVGRPPETPPGASITAPVAFNFANLPLPPGRRFVLEFTLDDEARPEWQIEFNTRAADAGTSLDG